LCLENAEEIIQPSSSTIGESIQIGEDLFDKGLRYYVLCQTTK